MPSLIVAIFLHLCVRGPDRGQNYTLSGFSLGEIPVLAVRPSEQVRFSFDNRGWYLEDGVHRLKMNWVYPLTICSIYSFSGALESEGNVLGARNTLAEVLYEHLRKEGWETVTQEPI